MESIFAPVENVLKTLGGGMNKRYALKSLSKHDYMVILKETKGGFVVKIVHVIDGREEAQTDFLSKELFDCCLRTGYITQLDAA